jgi:hypothetical protein
MLMKHTAQNTCGVVQRCDTETSTNWGVTILFGSEKGLCSCGGRSERQWKVYYNL